MGYTHYFKQKRPATMQEWSWIVAATKALLVYNDSDSGGHIKVAYEYDLEDTLPELNPQHIRFNGLGTGGHETFCLVRSAKDSLGEENWFCKTAQKPYDDLVTAVLAIAHHYAPGAWAIGSDGSEEEWAQGLYLAGIGIAIAEAEAGACPEVEFPTTEEDDEVA